MVARLEKTIGCGSFSIGSCFWRHFGAVLQITTSTAKKNDRPRQNVRLHPQMWEAIDDVRTKRPGVVSRNTWIAEAILEKLAREQDIGEPPARNRERPCLSF